MPGAGVMCNNAASSVSTAVGQGPFWTVKPVCKVHIFKEAKVGSSVLPERICMGSLGSWDGEFPSASLCATIAARRAPPCG